MQVCIPPETFHLELGAVVVKKVPNAAGIKIFRQYDRRFDSNAKRRNIRPDADAGKGLLVCRRGWRHFPRLVGAGGY